VLTGPVPVAVIDRDRRARGHAGRARGSTDAGVNR